MVSSGEWQTIQDAFHQATALPDNKRATFIDQLALSSAIKSHLLRLLNADRKNTPSVDNLKHDISKTISEITFPEIEHYAFIEKIAAGGMGEVFKARDLKLSRDVAIKILHSHRSDDQKAQQRFLREARAAAKIQHQNICPVFDVATTPNGMFYIVSAFCEGDSLAYKIQNNVLNYAAVFSIFEQLLNALSAAHAKGVIHRDLKPENIIVDEQHNIQLVDFGIAKNYDDLQTQTGDVLGTPDYMPPEQFRGEAFDHRSDIWSCGIILYELLLGVTPYQDKTAPEIIYSMLHENISIAAQSNDPLFPFFSLIQDCLQIDKSLRIASIDHVRQKLFEAKQSLEDQKVLFETPSYQIKRDRFSNESQTIVKETQRDFVALYLQSTKGKLDKPLINKLKSIATKYKGFIQQQGFLTNQINNDKITSDYLIVLFGYPLSDELKIENAKHCGQLFSDLLDETGFEFKLLAHLNKTLENETSFSADVLSKATLEQTHYLMKELKQSGFWLTDSFAKKLRNHDALIEETASIKDKFEQQTTCHLLSKFNNNDQSKDQFIHSHFIGRDSQLSFFIENWEQAKEGDQQRILISGEAGIGKSRLIYEFKKGLTDVENVNLIELDCSPYEKASTYFPILQFLHRQVAIENDSLEKASKEGLLNYLESRITASETEQLLFLKLMNVALDPEDEASLPTGDLLNRKYQDLMIRLLKHKQAHQTSLYIIEDLHWVDTATSIIIEKLLQPSSTNQSLMIMSSRPEFKPLWLSNLVTNNLYLSKLRANQSETLLRNLLKDYSKNNDADESTQKLLPQLIERSGGNPLFIEEIAKTFGISDADENLATKHIPETIQDSLIARLERIGVAHSLAQLAAVIGRDFNLEVLKQCQPLSAAEFNQQLHTLIQAEIIESTNTKQQYRFKHALIRDAAYQMITPASRKSLHQNLANTLETHFSATVENQPELLAQHWEAAGQIETALKYWLLAAQRNLQLSATDECIAICDQIIELAEHNLALHLANNFKLNAYMTKGPALMARFGYAEKSVKQVYSQALELCNAVENTELRFPVLFGLWTYHCVKAEHLNAQKLTQEMVLLSANMTSLEKCIAYAVTGMTEYYMGQFQQAQAALAKALGFHCDSDLQNQVIFYGHNFKIIIQSYQTWNESLLGNIEAAMSISTKTVAYAKQVNHPFSLTYALSFAAWFYLNLTDTETAERLITESIDVCQEYDIDVFLGLSMSLHSLILFSKGQLQAGEKMMAEAEEIYFSTGSELFIPSFLTAKAEVSMLSGDTQSADSYLDKSLQVMEVTKEEWGMGACLALKSVVHAHKQEITQATEYMQLATKKMNTQKALGLQAMLVQKGISIDTTTP